MGRPKQDPEGIVDTHRLLTAAESVGMSKAELARFIRVSPSTASGYGRPGKDGNEVAMPLNSRRILWAEVTRRQRATSSDGGSRVAAMYDDLTELVSGGVSEELRTLYSTITKALKAYKASTNPVKDSPAARPQGD